MAKYECDGCHKVIDVDPAVMDRPSSLEELYAMTKEELAEKPHCSCPGFMGWMEVGGRAWEAYHNDGIHPMSSILGGVKNLLDDHLKKN